MFGLLHTAWIAATSMYSLHFTDPGRQQKRKIWVGLEGKKIEQYQK